MTTSEIKWATRRTKCTSVYTEGVSRQGDHTSHNNHQLDRRVACMYRGMYVERKYRRNHDKALCKGFALDVKA